MNFLDRLAHNPLECFLSNFVKVAAWVDSATSAIPNICVQYHSNPVASVCYISRATFLRY